MTLRDCDDVATDEALQWLYNRTTQRYKSTATAPCWAKGTKGKQCHRCLDMLGGSKQGGVDSWDCKAEGDNQMSNQRWKPYQPASGAARIVGAAEAVPHGHRWVAAAAGHEYGNVAFLSNYDEQKTWEVEYSGRRYLLPNPPCASSTSRRRPLELHGRLGARRPGGRGQYGDGGSARRVVGHARLVGLPGDTGVRGKAAHRRRATRDALAHQRRHRLPVVLGARPGKVGHAARARAGRKRRHRIRVCRREAARSRRGAGGVGGVGEAGWAGQAGGAREGGGGVEVERRGGAAGHSAVRDGHLQRRRLAAVDQGPAGRRDGGRRQRERCGTGQWTHSWMPAAKRGKSTPRRALQRRVANDDTGAAGRRGARVVQGHHRPAARRYPTQTSFALDLSTMNKGVAYVNGFDIGRYWLEAGTCSGTCAPPVKSGHCYMHWKGCGKPTQTLYHVPNEVLKPKGNLVVLFEETANSVQARDLSGVRLRALHEHPAFD